MSTRSNIAIKLNSEDVNKDFIAPDGTVFNPGGKQYLLIYCHFDGYPSGVGADLIDKNFTYDTALDFIMQGDHSTVDEPYISRGEDWQDDKPRCYDEPQYHEEFLYCFKDNEWYIDTTKYGWKLLTEVLASDNINEMFN